MPFVQIFHSGKLKEAMTGPRSLAMVDSGLEFKHSNSKSNTVCLPLLFVVMHEPFHKGCWKQWPSFSCFDLPMAAMMRILRTSRNGGEGSHV